VDIGTGFDRALMTDMADGCELATAVHEYASGVIDNRLPEPDRD